nr:hypothetical protein [Tanacetum cinerariifolium]
MVPHEAFACSCAEGDVVLRQSYKPECCGPSTPPSYSSRPSTPPSYSSGPSTPPNYSSGSSRNAECSNCKHLRFLESGGGGGKKKKKKGMGSAMDPNDSGLASKGNDDFAIPIDKTTKVTVCSSNTIVHSSTPNYGLADTHKCTDGSNSTTLVQYGIPNVINTGSIPYINVVNS